MISPFAMRVACGIMILFTCCTTDVRRDAFRWGKRPVDEAETFGHMQVVEYLNNYAVAHKTELENKQNECIDDNDSCSKPAETAVQSPLP